MVFSDLFFLFVFIPAFALCYMLGGLLDRWLARRQAMKNHHVKNAMLVVFSLIFYAWGEPMYVFLMLVSVLLNYVAGRIIGRWQRHRRKALVGGLACNLLILATFKYAGFFAEVLNGIGIAIPVPHIALPIGISFYTFQSISYLVDVYRRESPAQRRFADLLLYISMFPQLIAGPIVRYGTIAEEINNRHVTASDLSDGIYRFLIGLGKKVILANQFSEIVDQFLVDGLGSLTTSGAWIGILAFTLQIYFDFSGYSDMAIGMGRCMGFHFKENFNHPYCCDSITDFWRRWHISLGSFFRDYVYIPMGGNRRHQAWNIMVVWMLTGMWHGASWNFIIWGLYFGLIVMTEKYTLLRLPYFTKKKSRAPSQPPPEGGGDSNACADATPPPSGGGWEGTLSLIFRLYSLLLVVTGWGIFYFDDFSQMGVFFNAYVGRAQSLHDFVTTSALTDNFWLWLTAIVFCMPVRKFVATQFDRRVANRRFKTTVVFATRTLLSVALFVASVALLVGATNNAFIYTRF